jgi:hypothetical protein
MEQHVLPGETETPLLPLKRTSGDGLGNLNKKGWVCQYWNRNTTAMDTLISAFITASPQTQYLVLLFLAELGVVLWLFRQL